jgi:hypothetical protein
MMKSTIMRRARHVAQMGEKRNAHRILVGKLEVKRDHWEDQDVGGWKNIIMYLIERGWDGVDWIGWI